MKSLKTNYTIEHKFSQHYYSRLQKLPLYKGKQKPTAVIPKIILYTLIGGLFHQVILSEMVKI